MRAVIYMFLGFIFISLGAYNLYSGYELNSPYIAGFGFAAIIVGAMMAMYGISQSRKKTKNMTQKNPINSYKNDPAEREPDGAIEIHSIIQSMGVVAVADKRVRDEEVETIASIYEEMLGMKIRNEEVREILQDADLMPFHKSKLESPTGVELQLYQLEAKGKAKAVVHLNHGMSEHIGRIAHDHRGHGLTTAQDAPLGTFAKSDGLAKVIADIDAVNTKAKDELLHSPFRKNRSQRLVEFGRRWRIALGCLRLLIKNRAHVQRF